MQSMSTIWRPNRPHYVSVPDTDKEQYIKRHEIVFSHTLTYRGRQGKIRQETLVRTFTNVTRNKQQKYDNSIMVSANEDQEIFPDNKPDIIVRDYEK